MLKEEIHDAMNSKEMKLEHILCKHGFSRSKARCMIFMLAIGTGTSKEIEKVMDLRQPEVSTSMKELYKEKMVEITTRQIQNQKGRPEKIYQLAKSKEVFVADIEKKMNHGMEKTIKNIDKLKKLLIK